MKLYSIVLLGVALVGTMAFAQTSTTPQKSESQTETHTVSGTTPKANPSAAPAEKQKNPPPKKHVANVKYNDRVAPAAPTAAPAAPSLAH